MFIDNPIGSCGTNQLVNVNLWICFKRKIIGYFQWNKTNYYRFGSTGWGTGNGCIQTNNYFLIKQHFIYIMPVYYTYVRRIISLRCWPFLNSQLCSILENVHTLFSAFHLPHVQSGFKLQFSVLIMSVALLRRHLLWDNPKIEISNCKSRWLRRPSDISKARHYPVRKSRPNWRSRSPDLTICNFFLWNISKRTTTQESHGH